MRIVFLTRRFWPEIGGVEKHTLEVGKRLVKKGHQVIVIAERPIGGLKQLRSESARDLAEKEGIKILYIKPGQENWFKKFRIWKELWDRREIFKGADIIHCHDVFFWYLPFRLFYPQKSAYVTFHGYEGNKIPGNKAIFSHRLAEIFTKGNISIGNFYKEWYGTTATIISFGAVSPKRKVVLKKPKKIKKILFAGRLEEETGIMEYLKALTLVSKKFKYSIDIVGDGALRQMAKEYCKEHKINARFFGFIKNVNKYIENSDFVFVSRYLGILEALSLKKPVFALYNNQIKKDYLKMTPFKDYIFIEKDASEVSDHLMFGHYKQKVTEGYKWVIKQTWEKMVNDYLILWKLDSS